MTKYSLNKATGCPNKFGKPSEMFANGANYVYKKEKKNVFYSMKLLFEPFFVNCKNENGFLKQLSYNFKQFSMEITT